MKNQLHHSIVVIDIWLTKVYSHFVNFWFQKTLFIHFEIAIYVEVEIFEGNDYLAVVGHPPSVCGFNGVNLHFLHCWKLDLHLIIVQHIFDVHYIYNIKVVLDVPVDEEPLFTLPQKVKVNRILLWQVHIIFQILRYEIFHRRLPCFNGFLLQAYSHPWVKMLRNRSFTTSWWKVG